MRRRVWLSGTALATTVAVIAACSSMTPAQINANAAKIVAIAQAGMTTLASGLQIAGVTLTGNALTAFDAAQAAETALTNQAQDGATAIASAAAQPVTGTAALITTAINVAIPVLQAVPGVGNIVSALQAALAMLPLVVTLAQTILAPATAGAVVFGNDPRVVAARRLGVVI